MSLYTLLVSFIMIGAPADGAATPTLQAPASPTADAATADPTASATPAAERMPEIDAAEALLRAGDFDGARKKLAEAQKKNPRLAPAGVIVARWYLANNQLASARAELERVVSVQPSEPEPYAILGDLAWRDRRIAETELLFREALLRAGALKGSAGRKTEVEAQAHAGLATVAEARGKWPAARDELTAWSKLDEKNSIPHQRLGYALYHLGKAKEALVEFQTAGKLNRDFIPEIALAGLYEASGDRENATRLMNSVVKRLPKNVAVRLAVANWDIDGDRLADAKGQVEAALAVDPDSLDAKLLAGGIARLEKDNSTAERYLEAAHLQSPANFAASNLLALALADQDDLAEQARALEFAEQNVQKYPQNSEAIATLGWTLFRLGRWDDANRTLRRALATGTLNADGAYFVAKMFEREGQAGEVKTLLVKALATKRLFAYQQDAQQLLAALDAASAPAAAPGPAPADAPPKKGK